MLVGAAEPAMHQRMQRLLAYPRARQGTAARSGQAGQDAVEYGGTDIPSAVLPHDA
jgi:hypothetical protein